MQIIKASVEQLTPPINGLAYLKTIEKAGRVCYKSESKITDESAFEFVTKLIKCEHEAMLEHGPSISMKFICDRGVSHEIVRHRLFSFAQESTRYCNYTKGDDITFIQPSWFEEDMSNTTFRPAWHGCLGDHNIDPFEDGSAESWWFWSCASSELEYNKLIQKGWSPQQARSVLPNSLKTEIIVTGNPRNWRHFFKLRTAATAHPQMREVATIALNMLQSQIPILFDDVLIS